MPTNASPCSGEHTTYPVRRHQVDDARPDPNPWSFSTPTKGAMIARGVPVDPHSSIHTPTPSQCWPQVTLKWRRAVVGSPIGPERWLLPECELVAAVSRSVGQLVGGWRASSGVLRPIMSRAAVALSALGLRRGRRRPGPASYHASGTLGGCSGRCCGAKTPKPTSPATT